MLLDNYFVGIIEDNARFFTIPSLIRGIAGCTSYFGYPTGFCQSLVTYFQPLSAIPSFILVNITRPVFAYNIVILGSLGLNIYFCLKFFKRFFEHYIAVLLSAIFIFSPYFFYQIRSHYELFQFWPVMWYLDILLFSKRTQRSVVLGFLLTLIMGISSYLGYFTLLLSTLYLISKLLFSKHKTIFIEKFWMGLFKTLIVFLLSSCVFLAPYIKSNVFVSRVETNKSDSYKIADRPLEDFIIFSSRPWYFLLPSVDNPVLGNFSESLLSKLSSSGNYLTQSYFKSEHSALFLGWANLLFALLGIVYIFKKLKKENWQINYCVILTVTLFMMLLTVPPVFVFKGITFYFPSLILFKLFPMFRVLARLGVFILFFVLIFTALAMFI